MRVAKSAGGGSIFRMINHSDFNSIISKENLLRAWQEFKRGKTKKDDVLVFEFNLEQNIFELHRELKEKTYIPKPYQEFFVCDPKLRHIHKASVGDRVVHQALYRKLYKVFDPQFIYDSYSCRNGKGTHKGVQRLSDFMRKLSKNNSQKIWYLKCDVTKFFDSIDHQLLKQKIALKVKDENTLWLCNRIIDSFSKSTGKGLPLGNVTSQLFANIYLHEFDHFMKHTLQTKYYVRYCDDFVILNTDKKYLEKITIDIQDFLLQKLGLHIHPEKIMLHKISQGIDFLGYVTFPSHKVIRTSTKKRMFRKLKKKPIESVLQSYVGITKHAYGNKVRRKLLKIYRENK